MDTRLRGYDDDRLRAGSYRVTGTKKPSIARLFGRAPAPSYKSQHPRTRLKPPTALSSSIHMDIPAATIIPNATIG